MYFILTNHPGNQPLLPGSRGLATYSREFRCKRKTFSASAVMGGAARTADAVESFPECTFVPGNEAGRQVRSMSHAPSSARKYVRTRAAHAQSLHVYTVTHVVLLPMTSNLSCTSSTVAPPPSKKRKVACKFRAEWSQYHMKPSLKGATYAHCAN